MFRTVLTTGVLGTLVLLTFAGIFSRALPADLRGVLFQRNPTVTPPATGLFIHRGYQAQPLERGSILLETAEMLPQFTALSFTFAVDSARAQVTRVRRTAITQQFAISLTFPAPGVVRVALAGKPRSVAAGQSLLEIELQLRGSARNPAGTTIELRLIDVEYLASPGDRRTVSHNGLLTLISNQDALPVPFSPFIADLEPAVFPLVQHRRLTIHGQALPSFPRVLLGSRPLPVRSASPTQIVADIPEDTPSGTYSLSVESILADEQIVIFDAVGPAGSVDILDELLFFSPNPVLANAQATTPGVVLWIPVHNPLGSTDPIVGSVDLSRIGGDPNVTFSGVGNAALGPGGVLVNWFRIPADRVFQLPENLETNVDYPITIRAENRMRSRDSAIELLQLRSQIPAGAAPSFGALETVPAAPQPGNEVTFYVDVTDPEGVATLERVSARLTPLRGGFQELRPVLSIPRGDASLTTMTFFTSYTIPASVVPGTYGLEFSARDEQGNEGTKTFPLVVAAPGVTLVGSPPQLSGRLEARPTTARPGSTVDFFAGVRDPDGTETVNFVSIDLISIGGSIEEMAPMLPSSAIGTFPVVYSTSFTLPTSVAVGTYQLAVRAVDSNGLEATAVIPLTVDTSQGGGRGNPPEFSGRLEASPRTVPLGGKVSFFIGVRDPEGSDTIAQVTVDTVDIDGTILPLVPVVSPVAGSTQAVVYSADFTLPSTVAPGVFSLPVQAVDRDGNIARTTLPLTVSALTQVGGVPVITRLLATPAEVPPDDRTEVSFTAEIEDGDGVGDIAIVRIDLMPLGLSVEPLRLQSETSTTTKGIFTSRRLRIGKTVRPATYDLQVEVEDKQRNRVQRNVRLTVGTQVAAGIPPELRDIRFVPEVGRPGKSVDLFVEVHDGNGTENLTVVADFTDLRGSVKELSTLISFPVGTLARQNTFAEGNIGIPDDLPVGVYDIPITAIDETGNIVKGGARLRIERGGEDTGQPPSIDVARSFQTPRVFVNDGETKGEVHVLVHDADDDVVTVIANLGSTAFARSATRREGIGDIELLCNESRSIVCMQPSAPESPVDRWFLLSDMVIPPATLPSTEPYLLQLTAIDAQSNTAKAVLPLQIGGAETAQALQVPPAFLSIVPVDEDELELLVSAPLAMETVDRSGRQFLIQPTLQAKTSLHVRRVAWDTTGRLLYLQTDPLRAGETYTFTAAPAQEGTPALTDVYGNRFSADRGGSLVFTAFTPPTQAPEVERATVIDETHIDLRFTTPVLPSSVHPDLLPSRFLLRSTTTGDAVSIRTGALREGARILRLTVDPLREGDRYRLYLSSVLGPGPRPMSPAASEVTFLALFPRGEEAAGPLVLPTPDLNRDGRVDFSDFALFSAVYGTEYDLGEAEEENPASSPSRPGTAPPPPSLRKSAPPAREGQFGGELPKLEIP